MMYPNQIKEMKNPVIYKKQKELCIPRDVVTFLPDAALKWNSNK